MMTPALFVLLVNGPLTIPPSESVMVPLPVRDRNTTLECSFEVISGSRVQSMILPQDGAEAAGEPGALQPLLATTPETSERFRFRFREAGDYALVLRSRGRFPAVVHLKVDLHSPAAVPVRTIPVERRRAVVTLSLLFFGAVMAFSARQFLKRA